MRAQKFERVSRDLPRNRPRSFKTLKTLLIAAFAGAVISATCSPASAQSTPGVDARQHNQAKRIYNGVQNGSLTPKETGQLIRGQARLRRQEHRIKSDGVVTRRERVRLHRNLNRQNRRIWRKKHN